MVKRKLAMDFAPLWELNSIWGTLTQEQQSFVEKHVRIVRYKKNEIIYREGETPHGVLTLISGKVRIYIEELGTRPQIIRLHKPGDFFGYRSTIADDTHTTCASALEECIFYVVETDAFLTVVQQNNEFCYKILEAMAHDLAMSDMRQVNLTQKHLRGRLAEAISSLADHYGYAEDGCTLAASVSREDLANMSNMTTANAIRTLSQFAQEGIVEIDGKKIVVLNPKELMSINKLGS
jgi:CRP-like cAMP-binding protein